MKPFGPALAAMALATLTPVAARAQTELRTNIGSYSGYVWRGLTFTNRAVLQPATTLVIPAGALTLSLGGWGNVEAGRYNGPTDLSEGGGAKRFDLTEFDWTGEAALAVGHATISVGTIGYIFPNKAEVSPSFNPNNNTLEVYSKIGFSGPLSPAVGVYYDVRKVKGAYIEGTLGQTVGLSAKVPLSLGLLAGFSAGQSAALDPAGVPTARYYSFRRDGLTHVDLSASVPVTVAGVTFGPAVHATFGSDPLTRIVAVGQTRRLKFWIGGSVSWAQLVQGQRRQVVAKEPADDDPKQP